MELRLKLHDESLLDYYIEHTPAYHDDAGIDLFTAETVTVPGNTLGFPIPLRISIEIKNKDDVNMSYYLTARSSISRTPLRLCFLGVIDAGYRGELSLFVDNHSNEDYTVVRGVRLAQVCSSTLEPLTLVLVDELSEGSRNDNGLGSSGTTIMAKL